MPATSLHDLLDSMHNTLGQLCRSRPAGLVTSFTRSFGLARLDLFCWRWTAQKTTLDLQTSLANDQKGAVIGEALRTRTTAPKPI